MQRSARHVVKVIGGGAEFDVGRGGKKLLRIKITAEVDGVKSDYTITYGRYGTNAALGFAVARVDAPGDKGADAERFAAVRGAEDTPEERGRYRARMRQGHPDGFKRFAEFADVIEKWLEETSRR